MHLIKCRKKMALFVIENKSTNRHYPKPSINPVAIK